MRVVKPYGTTKTAPGEDGALRRSIHPNSFRHEAKDVADFAESNPKLVLSQWISMIDKVITKPAEGNVPSLNQYNLREEIGTAAWSIIVDRDLLSAIPKRLKRLEREWWSRIHPYGREIDPTGALDFRGRWFHVFSAESDPASIDADVIAQGLYDHLYVSEKRLGEDVRPRTKGLISARAHSISENVPTLRQDELLLDPPWNKDDAAAYFAAPNILNRVTDAINKYEGQRASRSRRAAGRVLHELFGRLFAGSDGSALSSREAASHYPGLFALHQATKSRFQRLLRAPQAHWRRKLPKSSEELVAELTEDWRNREVNALIRLGKIIHYEAAPDGHDDSPAHLFDTWSADVSKSPFWTSEGQTAIKINEAFVRVWRHALSFAARTATNWADAEASIDRDILGAREREAAVDALNVDHFDRVATLLFGASSGRFAASTREFRQEVMALALDELSRLRNAAFHFSGLTSFLNVLDSLGDDAIPGALAAVKSLHADDAAAFDARSVADLKSVRAEHFLGQDQVDRLLETVTRGDARFDDLPSFQNVLGRARDAYYWRKDVDFRLPGPATVEALRDPAMRCQHLVLKLIYERGFGAWLCDLTADTLKTYVDRYTVRATNEARRISGNDKLTARAAAHIKILEGDSVFDLFAMLRAAAVAEARSAQIGPKYERDLGKYLRDLELDLIAQAFQDYVEQAGLGWAFDIVAGSQSEKPKSRIEVVAVPETPAEDWQCVMYFLLHLIPVDEVNKLSHQISRTGIRDGAQAHLAGTLLSLLSLYEASHDAKFEGLEGARGRATLEPLFEPPELADDVPKRSMGDAALGRGSVRALRETLRFEPPRRVIDVLSSVPITTRHMEALSTLSEGVAKAQEKRSALHDKWVKADHTLSDEDRSSYAECLAAIVEHRDVSHHALLGNHLKAYRLLIAALAKFVDYVGIWERDLYFVTLGVLYRSGVSPADVFSSPRSRRLLGRGQIIEAIRQRDQNDAADHLVEALRTFFAADFAMRGDARIAIRNELAHFGMLYGAEGDICLTDLINRTRFLTRYDRKRANRVSVSVGDLFARFGLEVTWDSSDGALSNAKLEAKTIQHLGDAALTEPLVGPEFVSLVRGML